MPGNPSQPPHNPELRDLIASKRSWSSPPKREHAMLGFRGWHERGYLPHRDEPGLTQFVTFRVADSFPTALRAEWSSIFEIENVRERRKELESYLDRGLGDCHLKNDAIAKIVDGALQFHHGKRYEILAWFVMSNHVHVLFKVGGVPMSVIVADWKEYTARMANKLLGRKGQFWAEDYWDTFIRDAAHELKSRRYIENNPTKAGLILDPGDWKWSSARLRNQNGELQL